MLSRSTTLIFAVVLAALCSGRSARADTKVDWSSYLEPAGSKGPAVKHDVLVPPPKTVAKAAKPSAVATPVGPKAKAKAPAKAPRKTAARPRG